MIISKISNSNNIKFGLDFSDPVEDFFKEQTKMRELSERDSFSREIAKIRNITPTNTKDVLEICKSDDDTYLTLKIHGKNSSYSHLQLLLLHAKDKLSRKTLNDIKNNIEYFYRTNH